MKVKEKSEKAGLKLNFQETKIVVSGAITSWQIDGGKSASTLFWETLFWGASKSLQMVTSATKVKDACFLDKSYDKN